MSGGSPHPPRASAVRPAGGTETRRAGTFGRLGVARGPVWIAAGAVLGIGLGVIFRTATGEAAVPQTLGVFALVAAAIGAAEEVIYRGFIQGRLRILGPAAAVVLAAALHTVYKGALFACVPDGQAVAIVPLVFWTLAGGCIFGGMREAGGLLSPLVAHAVFDIIVYGHLAEAPWWVFT